MTGINLGQQSARRSSRTGAGGGRKHDAKPVVAVAAVN